MNGYHWDGINYEIEVTPFKLEGKKNRLGQDVFWYVSRVRRVGQNAWIDLWDGDTPYYNPSPDTARETAKWYIRTHKP